MKAWALYVTAIINSVWMAPYSVPTARQQSP